MDEEELYKLVTTKMVGEPQLWSVDMLYKALLEDGCKVTVKEVERVWDLQKARNKFKKFGENRDKKSPEC